MYLTVLLMLAIGTAKFGEEYAYTALEAFGGILLGILLAWMI